MLNFYQFRFLFNLKEIEIKQGINGKNQLQISVTKTITELNLI